MGCGSSKQSPGVPQEPPAGSERTGDASADGSTVKQAGDGKNTTEQKNVADTTFSFDVELKRDTSIKTLGMTLGEDMTVEKIESEGLVPAWNAAQKQPDLRIREKDKIVVVNSIEGDVAKMLPAINDETQEQLVLRISGLRAAPGSTGSEGESQSHAEATQNVAVSNADSAVAQVEGISTDGGDVLDPKSDVVGSTGTPTGVGESLIDPTPKVAADSDKDARVSENTTAASTGAGELLSETEIVVDDTDDHGCKWSTCAQTPICRPFMG